LKCSFKNKLKNTPEAVLAVLFEQWLLPIYSQLDMPADVDIISFYSRPASDLKKREMHGSGIFNGAGARNGEGNGADRTAVRMHQVSYSLIKASV